MSGDIKSLMDQVKTGQGSDRNLDFWITVRIADPFPWYSDEELQADIELVGIEGMVIKAPYTASLDAVVALVEKRIPGARVGFDPVFFNDPEPHVKWEAIICVPNWDRWNPVDSSWITRYDARHADQCRAAIAALLVAIEAGA